MLHDFISANRDEIIARCRAKVATRFIRRQASPAIDTTAREHGRDLLAQGFTVSQVVHDYGDVCQTITELAVETDSPISADEFGTLDWRPMVAASH